ncbi:MAG TPA: putative sulfate exporter family transporter, partial [Syntrophobacteraceae bacterium]|nr:putative sulfate exporter family transporter [Syntrophobacteraceae bacterium]
MAANGRIDWTSLWKKEDWVAVWIGFIIILAILVGLKISTPKFKWTTETEFASFAKEATVLVEKLVKQAGDAGEAALQEQATALKGTLTAGDRKAIGAAAKKMEEACKGVKNEGLKKKGTQVSKDISGEAGNLAAKVFSVDNVLYAIYIGVAFLILSIVAMLLMGEKAFQFIVGFPFVFLIAWAAQFIAGNYTVLYYGVEYVLWCLFLGLLVSNTVGVPNWLMHAVRTEFYIKTGLVILGTGMLFTEIVQAGAYGIVQAILVVLAVWYLTFWVAKKLDVDDEFAAILSSAVSICGVSAAIATSGAVQGDPKKLSYTTSIVLICAVPMLIFQPLISKA